MEYSTLYDSVAETHDFIVIYPDDDDLVHPGGCWSWYNPFDWVRGDGDLKTIVGMIHLTESLRSIDPRRVYEIGMSSGALITSDLGAAYPDVFAAIGIMAGGPYGLDSCVAGSVGASISGPALAARAAFDEEGAHARGMPFVVFNGDKDNVVSPECDDEAVQQWLRTDNLVLSHNQLSPLSLVPASVTDEVPAVADGHGFKVISYATANGYVVGEHYVIDGMGHFWSGGSSDPRYKQFVDPKGPSAAELSWDFFSHYGLPVQVASADLR